MTKLNSYPPIQFTFEALKLFLYLLKNVFLAQRVGVKFCPAQENAIGTFLTNYDVTNKKHYIDAIYSIE